MLNMDYGDLNLVQGKDRPQKKTYFAWITKSDCVCHSDRQENGTDRHCFDTHKNRFAHKNCGWQSAPAAL